METNLNEILDYVFHTPQNTNPAILMQLLREYKGNGGDISPEAIQEAVNKYLEENPIMVDRTLTQDGMAANAKTVGDLLALKADKATTIEGYGITNAITDDDSLILECNL